MSDRYFTPTTAVEVIGETFSSDWLTIDQDMINVFGKLTGDSDPHHVDPAYCEEHSPWGKPISFAFLTMSLLTPMLYQVYRYSFDGASSAPYPASYGFKKLRLVAPVPVDSRIRGHFTVNDVRERKPGQLLVIVGLSVEIEGEEKPALTGEWELLWITPMDGHA